jgi:dTDP-4-dehydrorhamnose reductase
VRLLVLGASGMAGHAISVYFQERGHDVTTLTRKPFSIGRNLNLELTVDELPKLKKVVEEGNYDAIINCIGILNENAENEKDVAVFLNSYLPHYLNKITKKLKTKIVHMSTDCVFSGELGNYKENSFQDGATFYDRSKALGELNDSSNITFRNSIIGPDINEDGIGLFNWFMKQNTNIKGYDRAIWTGVTTLTLAKAMESALEQNLTGLYNLVNNESINKFEMLVLFNQIFKENSINIEPDSKFVIDKSLRNTREDFDFLVPSYKLMFIEMKDWIIKHKELYPHYNINRR